MTGRSLPYAWQNPAVELGITVTESRRQAPIIVPIYKVPGPYATMEPVQQRVQQPAVVLQPSTQGDKLSNDRSSCP